MSGPWLPDSFPREYEAAAKATYERVMKTLIEDTQALAGDVPQWVEMWSDSIGAAITLSFVIGARWKERYPDEPMVIDFDAEP